jgi:uncharacterized membrane protein YpjA
MGKRKTVSVKDMVDYANLQLSRTDEIATKDFKIGICTMIESVLHIADQYQGFMFINKDDIDVNTLGYYSRKYFFR